MNSFKEIAINDSKWDSVVRACHKYDFYHTQAYNRVEIDQTSHKALLVYNELDENFIAMPLIIRSINDSDYFDCTSAYGYCGPISNLPENKIPPALKKTFQEEIFRFFKRENIVSAFSRLHPLISQNHILKGLGDVLNINKTIAIDLELPIDEQRRQFRKSNKSEINQLRKKKGYTVKQADSDEEIEAFVSIYNDTMQRVKASEYYFFEYSYFKKMLENTSYNAILLLAYKENKITAGAIFTITKNIMQYHLAGTREEYARDTPMKLILDEARLHANTLALQYLHLGGGVGGSDDDSLFRFKSGFSKNTYQFQTWQYICNKVAYEELIALNGRNKPDYFPEYKAVYDNDMITS